MHVLLSLTLIGEYYPATFIDLEITTHSNYRPVRQTLFSPWTAYLCPYNSASLPSTMHIPFSDIFVAVLLAKFALSQVLSPQGLPNWSTESICIQSALSYDQLSIDDPYIGGDIGCENSGRAVEDVDLLQFVIGIWCTRPVHRFLPVVYRRYS